MTNSHEESENRTTAEEDAARERQRSNTFFRMTRKNIAVGHLSAGLAMKNVLRYLLSIGKVVNNTMSSAFLANRTN